MFPRGGVHVCSGNKKRSDFMTEKRTTILRMDADQGACSGMQLREMSPDELMFLIHRNFVRTCTNRRELMDSMVLAFSTFDLVEYCEIYLEQGGDLIDRNEVLIELFRHIKFFLFYQLMLIDGRRSSKKADGLMEVCTRFSQIVLMGALKPLHHGDSASSQCSTFCSFPNLFSEAVTRGLLHEAVLLYDTGLVCFKELAVLAQKDHVKKILAGQDNSPMAVFLCQVLTQPPSLQSLCRTVLARLLGDDLKGKLDRARKLGIPLSQWESIVNLHQTKYYMMSVSKECTDSSQEELEVKMAAFHRLTDLWMA